MNSKFCAEKVKILQTGLTRFPFMLFFCFQSTSHLKAALCDLTVESVIKVVGTVRKRPAGQENKVCVCNTRSSILQHPPKFSLSGFEPRRQWPKRSPALLGECDRTEREASLYR